MNKSRKSIIDKVEKLLALANSDNEAEAKLAAQRAQELLTKYNLTMNEIEDETEDKYILEEVVTNRTTASPEFKYVAAILDSFFFVDVLHSSKAKEKVGRVVRVHAYKIIGQPHNVAIAIHVRDFLSRSFKQLFKHYMEETGCKKSSRTSFYYGLYQGICAQLEETKKKVEQQCGLVVVEDAGLKQFIYEKFPNIRQTTSRTTVTDRAATAHGYEQGKNLKIARGLGGGPSSASSNVIAIGGR